MDKIILDYKEIACSGERACELHCIDVQIVLSLTIQLWQQGSQTYLPWDASGYDQLRIPLPMLPPTQIRLYLAVALTRIFPNSSPQHRGRLNYSV